MNYLSLFVQFLSSDFIFIFSLLFVNNNKFNQVDRENKTDKKS